MDNPLPSENEIKLNWKKDHSHPLVSICCITFNHERFLESAIRGFLIQKTDFPFEILIHDDASSDGTVAIIEKYTQKYPSLIRSVIQKTNQKSQGISPSSILYKIALGKYIALCDGDDYWIDPNKLQIQVEFLEKNTDYVMSCHDASVIDSCGKLISNSSVPDSFQRDMNRLELIKAEHCIKKSSVVFRSVLQNDPPERGLVLNQDTFTYSILGNFGDCKFHHNILPAAYRVHSEGVWSMISVSQKQTETNHTYFFLHSYYHRLNQLEISEFFLSRYFLTTVPNLTSGLFVKMMIKKLLPKMVLKLIQSLRRASRKTVKSARFHPSLN